MEKKTMYMLCNITNCITFGSKFILSTMLISSRIHPSKLLFIFIVDKRINHLYLSQYAVGKIKSKHHILSLKGISLNMSNAIKTNMYNSANFYLQSKKPKNSNRVQFSNIIDTTANY